MYCSKCGTENPEESQFCNKCGNSLKNENKKTKNIFSLLSLICLIIGFLLTDVTMFIFMISSFVLAIIGISKSNKLKKELGKRKGIVMSIITLVISSIIIIGTILLIIITIATQPDYDSLTQNEKIAYQGVKALYYGVSDEKSLEINSIYCQEITTETEHYYKIYINCTGKNSFNGTVKNCYIYRTGHSSSIVNGGTTHTQWLTGFGNKLDKDKIMQVYNMNK